MTRTVMCVKLQKELPGLNKTPFPGTKGQWVYDNVSIEAWKLWQEHQIRLINEKHLSLISPDDRKYLIEQMIQFLSNKQYDKPEGYIEVK